jgi:hypothetical protein
LRVSSERGCAEKARHASSWPSLRKTHDAATALAVSSHTARPTDRVRAACAERSAAVALNRVVAAASRPWRAWPWLPTVRWSGSRGTTRRHGRCSRATEPSWRALRRRSSS